MEILRYASILWKRKWIVLIVPLVMIALAFAGNKIITPSYRAVATIRINSQPVGDHVWIDYNLDYSDRLKNTFINLATSETMLAMLQERLEITELPTITLENVFDTELIYVSVAGPDPQLIQDAANTFAQLLQERDWQSEGASGTPASVMLDRLNEIKANLVTQQENYAKLLARQPDSTSLLVLEQQISTSQNTYDRMSMQYEQLYLFGISHSHPISIAQPAVLPTAPTNSKAGMNLFLGAVIGILAGVALAFTLEAVDSHIYTPEQVQTLLGIQRLGTIPFFAKYRFVSGAKIPKNDAFYRLSNLLITHKSKHLDDSTILITSATPHEGVSTLVANLASCLAKTDQTVLIIDGNIHNPAQGDFWSVSSKANLNDELNDKQPLKDRIKASSVPGVSILASKTGSDVLSIKRVKTLLDTVKSQFNFVLIDSAAILASPESSAIAPLVDGVILVVYQGKLHAPTLESAYQELNSLSVNILGFVLNGLKNHKTYDAPPRK